MLGLVLLAIAGYGTFNDWDGGVSWGPRYLMGAAPFLAIGVAAVLASSQGGKLGAIALGALGLWGVGVSALGVLFDYQRGWRDLWDVGAKPEQILWDPHFSIIGAHLRLLRQWGNGLIGPDLYLVHKLGFWWAPAFAAGLFLVAGVWATLRVRLALKSDGV